MEDKFPDGYRLYQVINFIMTNALNETNYMQNKFCFIYKQVRVFAARLIFSVCFLQDNDNKNKSKSTQDWMAEKGMLQNVMTTPASSPDLNPIENVWASMKYYLQTVAKPRTKDQLIQGIRDFWGSLSTAQCGRYIDHIHKVIPVIVLNDGEASGF